MEKIYLDQERYYKPINDICTKYRIPYVYDWTMSLHTNMNYLIKLMNGMAIEFGIIKDIIEEFIRMFDKDLQETIIKTLEDWQEEGKLEGIINEALFNQKLDKSVFEEHELKTSEELININKEYKPYIIANKEGLKPNTGEDVSEVFQNLVNMAIETNRTLFIGEGDYLIEKPIHITKSGLSIEGVPNKTKIIKNNDELSYIKFGDFEINKPALFYVYRDTLSGYVYHLDMKNIVLVGNNNNYGVIGSGVAHSIFDKIVFAKTITAMHFNSIWMTQLNRIHSQFNRKHLIINSGTSINVNNWHCDGGSEHDDTVGFTIDNLVYSNFNACGVDRCVRGYDIGGKSYLSLNGSGAEVWSQTFNVRDNASVVINGGSMELHGGVRGSKYTWIFAVRDEAKVTLNNGRIRFLSSKHPDEYIGNYHVGNINKYSTLINNGCVLDYNEISEYRKSEKVIIRDTATYKSGDLISSPKEFQRTFNGSGKIGNEITIFESQNVGKNENNKLEGFVKVHILSGSGDGDVYEVIKIKDFLSRGTSSGYSDISKDRVVQLNDKVTVEILFGVNGYGRSKMTLKVSGDGVRDNYSYFIKTNVRLISGGDNKTLEIS